MEIERSLGGGRSIDMVLKDGTFVELKNLDWSNSFYSDLTTTKNSLTEQLDFYQTMTTGDIEFVFKNSVPDDIAKALRDKGAQVRTVE